ncbi:MAG: VOC family protein [Acidimicrobiales bacterium]
MSGNVSDVDHLAAAVTAVMCDSVDLDRTVAFWTRLLRLHEAHRTDTYVYLEPMSADGPHLAFQLVSERRSGKNRIHLDIRVSDLAEAEQAIVAAGGSVLDRVEETGFPPWSVMADPAGNEFCIYVATG